MRKQMRQTPTTQARNRSRTRTGPQALRRHRRVHEAAVILSILVVISLFCVWSRVAVLQTGYRIHDKLAQYEELQEEYRALRLELATRKSPANLVPQAQKQLGLRQPAPDQIIVVPHSVRYAEQVN